MSIDKWTLESALDAAVDCLNRHLPGYIQSRLDADAERDRPLINGKLPVPKVVTTGMLDDLAADWVTPSIFLNATSTSYQNYNASSLLDSQPRVTATILMSEGDIDTSEQRVYSNALSMYSDGVRYILSTVFPEDGGCEVGVQAATPDSVQYSPLVRPDGYPVWLRWSEVSVVWTQRVVNSWNTDPPPFDPLTLGPLVWLDPTDQSTLFIDAAGTTPVVASGDPVGLWKNKGTAGSAGNAVQTVSANRPLYGDRVVTFDGAGSRLALGYNPTLPQSVYMHADRYGPPPTGGATRIIATPTTLPYVQLLDTLTGVSAFFSEGGSASGSATNIAGRSSKTIGAEFAQGLLRSWVRGTSASGALSTPASNFTAAGAWNLNLNGTVQYRCGHVFIFNRILTDDERTKLLEWMEAHE